MGIVQHTIGEMRVCVMLNLLWSGVGEGEYQFLGATPFYGSVFRALCAKNIAQVTKKAAF
jgi:hypothetical protein